MAVSHGNRESVIRNTAAAAWTTATWATSDSPAPPSMSGADLLLVHIVFGNNIATNSITHNGNSLTKIGSNYFSGLGQREEFWYMLNPDSSGNIVVNLASAMFNGISICAMGFVGATGIGGHGFNGAGSDPNNQNRTVGEGSMVYVTGISTVAHTSITIDGSTILPANFEPNQVNVNDIVSGAWSTSSHSAGTIATATDAQFSNITNSYVEIEDAAATPTLSASTSSLTGFTYKLGHGPSSEQTFLVSGNDLTASATVSASTNYEVSDTTLTGFSSTETLTQTGGDIDGEPVTIYVRLKSGLSVGTYNSDTITISSAGATDETITLNGEVIARRRIITM
jgi:hypothetical protein